MPLAKPLSICGNGESRGDCSESGDGDDHPGYLTWSDPADGHASGLSFVQNLHSGESPMLPVIQQQLTEMSKNPEAFEKDDDFGDFASTPEVAPAEPLDTISTLTPRGLPKMMVGFWKVDTAGTRHPWSSHGKQYRTTRHARLLEWRHQLPRPA